MRYLAKGSSAEEDSPGQHFSWNFRLKVKKINFRTVIITISLVLNTDWFYYIILYIKLYLMKIRQ